MQDSPSIIWRHSSFIIIRHHIIICVEYVIKLFQIHTLYSVMLWDSRELWIGKDFERRVRALFHCNNQTLCRICYAKLQSFLFGTANTDFRIQKRHLLDTGLKLFHWTKLPRSFFSLLDVLLFNLSLYACSTLHIYTFIISCHKIPV